MIKKITNKTYESEKNNIKFYIEKLFEKDDDVIANVEETMEHLDFIFSQKNNGAFLLLNIDEEELKCMVNFLEHNNIKKEWSLFSVFTKKEQRRNGLAEEIISIGLKEIKKYKGSIIIAGIEYENISSQRLHEKIGFKYNGKEWNEYAEGFPEKHMGYILNVVDIVA